MVAPTILKYTQIFIEQLTELDIPYIYIDSNIKEIPPLAFSVKIPAKVDISPHAC